MWAYENHPRLLLVGERDDDAINASEMLHAQLRQRLWAGDAIRERCTAAGGEVVEKRLVSPAGWPSQTSRLLLRQAGLDALNWHGSRGAWGGRRDPRHDASDRD